MKKDKSTNQSNSNFRQQEGTARKLEKDYSTAEQQQLNRTTSALDGSSNNEGKLKKQNSEQISQAREEFRQQENTVSKIEKTLNTSSQKQINQATTVLDHPVNDQNSSSNDSKLKKQYSNQGRGEFRQQESTASKIEKTLNTSGQQQINQATTVLDRPANVRNTSSIKGKLKKYGQGTLRTTENVLKSGAKTAATKYQKELEKDDQGVKVASQGITASVKAIKVSAKLHRKLRQKAISVSAPLNNLQQKGMTVLTKPFSKLRRKRITVSAKTFGVQQKKLTISAKTLNKLKRKKEVTKRGKENLLSKGAAPRKLKLKRKEFNNKNFKKARENPLTKQKTKESNLKKIAKSPALVLKNGTLKYQKELEKDDQGVKLVSQGVTAVVRARKKLLKGTSKFSAKSGKLNKQSTKLLKSHFNKNKKLQVESKVALKKKVIKKKLYAPKRDRAKAFKGAMSSFSNRISKIFKNIGKFKLSDIKKFIGAKIAAAAGSGLLGVLPLILIAIICLIIASVFAGIGSKNPQEDIQMGGAAISPEVKKWCSLIETEAKAQGMEAYVDLLASIIQVESGGTGTRDIMQSSESAGYPVNYWPTEELSIRQGVKHLKNIVTILQGFGAGYESNTKLLAQSYNFGSAFAGYVGRQGGEYTLEVAEAYSRDVVAPSLGNHNGATVPYINETSIRLGKTYRYVNGGNFLYGELVGQYGGCSGGAANITGDFAIVMAELEKYQGWPYVWGGKNPSTGFDCSGLTSWGLKQIGINLPSYAQTQYNMTVPISESEAQPGDLIFFKGTYGAPNHISHVGFYIDANTMYDSNGSGIGYHNWKDPYWQKHFAGIRRVVTK